jgi:outer membrane lipopolysaccharide assembly protein LptE/RlpB
MANEAHMHLEGVRIDKLDLISHITWHLLLAALVLGFSTLGFHMKTTAQLPKTDRHTNILSNNDNILQT